MSARLAPDEKLVMVMKLDSQINTADRTLYDILADSLFGQPRLGPRPAVPEITRGWQALKKGRRLSRAASRWKSDELRV